MHPVVHPHGRPIECLCGDLEENELRDNWLHFTDVTAQQDPRTPNNHSWAKACEHSLEAFKLPIC